MNLEMIGFRNETEISLLSITKNCERLIKQTDTKPKKLMNLSLLHQGKQFSPNQLSQLKDPG